MTGQPKFPGAEIGDLRTARRSATCTLDLDGRLTWAGEDAAFLLGDSAGRATNANFADYWQSGYRSAVSYAIGRAGVTGQARVSGRAADGGWVEALIELRRTRNEAAAELIVTMTNATGMSDASEFNNMLFEALPVSAWMAVNTDATFIVGNSITEQTYGFSKGANQSLSQPVATLHNRYRFYRQGKEVHADQLPVQRSARGEDVRDEEFEVRFNGGQVSHIVLNASPIRDSTGRIVGSICVERDVTSRTRYERTQRLLLECSRATGPLFFTALTSAISEALGARQVYIAEVSEEDPRVLHTLSAHIDGEPGTYGTFIPHKTPCASVMLGTPMFIPSGVIDQYGEAEVLRKNEVDSYVGTPLRASDGKVIGMIGVLHNHPLDPALHPLETVQVFAGRAAAEIQRIRSIASLRQSEEKYRIITDVIPSLIAFVDAEERYQFTNDAYKRWFGVSPDQLKGVKVSSFMTADFYAKVSPYVRRALSGERVSFEAHSQDMPGGPRHILAEYVPQFSDDRRVLGFFAFVRDISELKANNEALRRSEEQFRTLFEHLPVGVAMVDRQGNILLENDVLSALLPTSQPGGEASIFERACIPYADREHPLPPDRHPIEEALRGRISQDVDFECHHPNGQARWVRMRSVPIRGASNEVVGALVVVDDIHNEKLADDRRKLLINELNHRVKNTLAGVQSIATQTFRQENVEPAALQAFEDRLLALSNVHNQLTSESWEGADLRLLASVVLEPHNPGAGRLRINGPSLRLKPQAALALAMALHELATNAVKYGSLSVSDGTLDLNWRVAGMGEDRRLQLKWVERGGPPVSPPATKGFGTRLIERSLAFELNSESGIRFDPEGVTCEIDASLWEVVG